jgi:hypothetical protein
MDLLWRADRVHLADDPTVVIKDRYGEPETVSEVRPGDSIRFDCDGVTRPVEFVYARLETRDGEVDLCTERPDGEQSLLGIDRNPDSLVTVGYSNRKAKRARGKMARRQRFANRGAAIEDAKRREDAKRYAAGEVHRLQMKGGGERFAALVRDIVDGSEAEPMPDTIALPNTPAGRATADAISALNERHRAFVDAQSAALASSVSPAEDAAIIRQSRIAGRSPGPMSATLADAEEPAQITRNVPGFGAIDMDGINVMSGRAWWDE